MKSGYAVVVFLVGVLVPGWAAAMSDMDAELLAEVELFRVAKPLLGDDQAQATGAVDMWERAGGIKGFLTLRYYDALPFGLIKEMNSRVRALRLGADSYRPDESPLDYQLRRMVRLYAEFAAGYLSGSTKYNDYMAVRDYVESMGQGLAEDLRGSPYSKSQCALGEVGCDIPPPVWAQ